jgi:hypothetical protein
MSTNDPEVYNVLSFEQWQLVMYRSLCLGKMLQFMDYPDENRCLRAIRTLVTVPDLLQHSRASFFLLGFRVKSQMEIYPSIGKYSRTFFFYSSPKVPA